MKQDKERNDNVHFIDYRDLVAKFTCVEHARRADEYFAGFDEKSTIARKPFAALDEVGGLCAGVGAMLTGLKLFGGARVLEFGAATCWFSRILALLRCEVVAADVSGKALELGRKLIKSDPLTSDLQVDFVRLEDERLPFPDAHFDRVLCFDTLHHVPNQQGAIAEFARVLKDPGIIALHEPGPHHSRGAQSQFEMRKHEVIEADVHIDELIACAKQHGISDAKMAVYTAQPIFSSLDEFDTFMADPVSSELSRALSTQIHNDFQNRRICFLSKGDLDVPVDSRRPEGLSMEFDGTAELHVDHVHVAALVRNSGNTVWLPSSKRDDTAGHPGDVNIGVHLIDKDGLQHVPYYFRQPLCEVPVPPGKSVKVAFDIPYPDGMTKYCLEVDLVAEHVAWFEMGGSNVFKIEIG
jgi:SAM-dependent methyltransferase